MKPHKQRSAKTYDTKVHGKRYGAIHKIGIKALLDSGMTVPQIARENNVSVRTVWRVKDDQEVNDLDADAVADVKEGLKKLAYKRSFQFLKSVDTEKIEKASLVQTMVGAKIGLEMGRLMEGLSTENIKIEDDGVLERDLKSKYEELERIKNAKVIDVSDQASTQDLATESTGLSASETQQSSKEAQAVE